MTPTWAKLGAISLQIEPFGADRELIQCETGEMAARLRYVRYEALRHRVRDLREHDRYRAGRFLDGPQISGGHRQDRIRHEPNQLRCVDAGELGVEIGVEAGWAAAL